MNKGRSDSPWMSKDKGSYTGGILKEGRIVCGVSSARRWRRQLARERARTYQHYGELVVLNIPGINPWRMEKPVKDCYHEVYTEELEAKTEMEDRVKLLRGETPKENSNAVS